MPDEILTDLLRQSQVSFIGGVESPATADQEGYASVRIVQILHSPPALHSFLNQVIELRLLADRPPPEKDSRWAFFVDQFAIADVTTAQEVGRVDLDYLGERSTRSVLSGVTGPVGDLLQEIELDTARDLAQAADAVVVGQVAALRKVGERGRSEHDPDWWRATITVRHVERGDIPGEQVEVLYANSLDVHWRDSPKPQASQQAVWLLHRTQDELAELAPYALLESRDIQPLERLEAMR